MEKVFKWQIYLNISKYITKRWQVIITDAISALFSNFNLLLLLIEERLVVEKTNNHLRILTTQTQMMIFNAWWFFRLSEALPLKMKTCAQFLGHFCFYLSSRNIHIWKIKNVEDQCTPEAKMTIVNSCQIDCYFTACSFKCQVSVFYIAYTTHAWTVLRRGCNFLKFVENA